MLVTNELINAAKMARRMTTNAYDAQVSRLLTAALRDLYVAGVDLPATAEPLAVEAAITYFLVHFGSPDEYDRLKASYDEQKAQLSTLTGFTDWGFNAESEETTLDIDSTTTGAEILTAYQRGEDLRLVVGNTVMLATGYDYTDGVLSVSFFDGVTPYKVTTDGDTVTTRALTGVFDVHVTDPVAHGEIPERPAPILAAHSEGKEIRLVCEGCIMKAVSEQMTNGTLILCYRENERLYKLSVSLARIELYSAEIDTSYRSIWLKNYNNG